MEALKISFASQQEPRASDSKKIRGAVAIFIKHDGSDLWLLMIKRGESPQDPWSGQMAFPGGHASPRDHSLFDTAAREVQEEVGIDAHIQRFFGCLDNVYPRNHPMIIAPFVFVLTNRINPKTSREAQEVVWVPISFLLDPKNVSSLPLTIRGKEISVPCYNYSNHMIWGMSFRIIRELLTNMKARG